MKAESKSNLFLYAIAGGLTGCLAVVVSAFTIYPGLQEILLDNMFVFCIFMGGPGLVAGLLVGRFSKHHVSKVLGLSGIVLGVLWHLHLSGLSAQVANASHYGSGTLTSVYRVDGFFLTRWITNIEYAVLINGGVSTGLVMLALPVLLGILGTYVGNRVVKQVQGRKEGKRDGTV